MITVVVVLLGHLEHGRVEQRGVSTGVLVDEALELGFLLVILGLERRPLRFVVALFEFIVAVLHRLLDHTRPLYRRVNRYKRSSTRHRLQ
ncbi:hypothetical protein D3C76_757400 [compost metagenome]